MIINLVIILTVLFSHLLTCFIISKMFRKRNKKEIHPVLIYIIGYLILAIFVMLLMLLLFSIELVLYLMYFCITFGEQDKEFTLKQKINKGMGEIHYMLPSSSIKKYAIIFGITHIVIIIITFYVYGRYSKLYLKGTRKLENDNEETTKEYNFDIDQDSDKFTMSLISTSSMIYLQSTLFNGVFIAAIILSYLNTFT
jgi:hypothetical protein